MIPCELFEMNSSDFMMLDQYTRAKIREYNEETNYGININQIFENLIYLKKWHDFRKNLFAEKELTRNFNRQILNLRNQNFKKHKFNIRKANLSHLLK